MNVKKLTDKAIIPSKGSAGAAGYDLYTTESYELKPGERKAFKTDIALAIPEGFYGRVAPRSGLAVKHGIDVLAGVVDCFSQDSLIKTETGDKYVTDLKLGDVVYSVNENMEIERDLLVAIVCIGNKEILQIETNDGVLEVTPGTLIYTTDGIKPASELKENDQILSF